MGKELPKTGMDFAVLSELVTRSRFVLYCPMPWAPTITEELRNDVRFALGWKVGKKLRPLTDTERDMIAAAIVEHIRLCNWPDNAHSKPSFQQHLSSCPSARLDSLLRVLRIVDANVLSLDRVHTRAPFSESQATVTLQINVQLCS